MLRFPATFGSTAAVTARPRRMAIHHRVQRAPLIVKHLGKAVHSHGLWHTHTTSAEHRCTFGCANGKSRPTRPGAPARGRAPESQKTRRSGQRAPGRLLRHWSGTRRRRAAAHTLPAAPAGRGTRRRSTPPGARTAAPASAIIQTLYSSISAPHAHVTM